MILRDNKGQVRHVIKRTITAEMVGTDRNLINKIGSTAYTIGNITYYGISEDAVPDKIREMEDLRHIERGLCPICSEGFTEGPSGGMSINVTCTNNHKFNIASGYFCERLS